MGPGDWLSGANALPATISLDPKKRPKEVLTVFQDKPVQERPRQRKASTTSNGKNGEVRGEMVYCPCLVNCLFRVLSSAASVHQHQRFCR